MREDKYHKNKKLYIFVVLFVLLAIIVSVLLSTHTVQTEKHSRAQQTMQKALVYLNANRFVEAMEQLTTALTYAEEENDQHAYLQIIGNIGNVYGDMGDESRALHYYLLGYDKAKKLGMADLEYKYLVNIVGCYCVKKDLNNAKKYFELQTQVLNACPDKNNVAFYLLYNEGMIAQVEKEYSMAKYYHEKALQFVVDHDMGDVSMISQMLELANVETEQQNFDEALVWIEKADSVVSKTEDKAIIADVYSRKSNIYAMMGNTDEAKRLKSMSLNITDSVFNRKQFDIANNKLFEHEKEQSQKEIDGLESQNKHIIIFSIFVVLVVVLVSVLAIRLRRTNKRLTDMYKIMIRKNADLEKRDLQNQQLLQQYVENIKDSESQDLKPETTTSNDVDDAIDADIDDNRDDGKSIQTQELLSVEQRNILLNRINKVMQDITLISSSDFGLKMLAEKVESNTRYVSWVINYAYGKNLRSLINECRIREACRLFSDTENYGNLTIRTIYEMLGYGSASSFIQAFKKETGMSPSEYLQLVRQNAEEN